MENSEAINWLTRIRDRLMTTSSKQFEAMTIAIAALEQQGQTKEAIPHRNYQYLSDYWCECGWHLGKKGDVKFCADCGRRIKWD